MVTGCELNANNLLTGLCHEPWIVAASGDLEDDLGRAQGLVQAALGGKDLWKVRHGKVCAVLK